MEAQRMFGCDSTAEEVTQGVDASHLTALITGATSGVGAETTRVLAMRGARVVLAVRNLKAGECLKEGILQEIPHARLHVLHLDLNSMASVSNFYEVFKSLKLPLNILMNNAGTLNREFQLSEDGFEAHFAINHLGHFLLTSLLLKEMEKTAIETGVQGRIINISSRCHQLFTKPYGINFDSINDPSSFDSWGAYGISKLANILHANELSRKFKEEGINVVVNSLHPGVIRETSIFRDFSMEEAQKMLDDSFGVGANPVFFKTNSQGAATQCFLALHPSLENCSGKYFQDCKEASPSELCNNEKLAKELWDFSAKATQCFLALPPSLENCSRKHFQDCKEASPSELCSNEKLAKELWDCQGYVKAS